MQILYPPELNALIERVSALEAASTGGHMCAYCGTKTNLTTSWSQIPLTHVYSSSGTMFSLASNVITCAKAGRVLISGSMYVKRVANCDNLQFAITQRNASGAEVSNSTVLARYPTITNGDDNCVIIPSKVFNVGAGDKINLAAANWKASRGYVEGNNMSFVDVVYLGGV